MNNHVIPEAAVEAAVLAIYDRRIPISEDEVRVILEAAAPHMNIRDDTQGEK